VTPSVGDASPVSTSYDQALPACRGKYSLGSSVSGDEGRGSLPAQAASRQEIVTPARRAEVIAGEDSSSDVGRERIFAMRRPPVRMLG
jgi:hypothetical protein